MAEYIDRNTFLAERREWYCENCNRRKNSKGKLVYEIGDAPCRACDIGDILDAIEDYHAADVVERKIGKWEHDGSNWENRFICSACGHKIFEKPTNYCPNCGAVMVWYARRAE